METRELAATPAYSTALGALILEVYYRYPRMDQLIEPGNAATATSPPKNDAAPSSN
jgi:hypothetical protein